MAGHGIPQSRPPLLRELLYRGARGLYLWRRNRLVREVSDPLPQGWLYHRGFHAGECAAWLRILPLPHHGRARREDVSRKAVARVFGGDLPRDGDVGRRAAGRLAQLEPAGAREDVALPRVPERRRERQARCARRLVAATDRQGSE